MLDRLRAGSLTIPSMRAQASEPFAYRSLALPLDRRPTPRHEAAPAWQPKQPASSEAVGRRAAGAGAQGSGRHGCLVRNGLSSPGFSK